MRHEQSCFWNKITKYVSAEARRGEWRMLFFWWSKSDVDCVFWVHKLYSWWIHFLLKMCKIIWEIVGKKNELEEKIWNSFYFLNCCHLVWQKKGFRETFPRIFSCHTRKKQERKKMFFAAVKKNVFLSFIDFVLNIRERMFGSK